MKLSNLNIKTKMTMAFGILLSILTIAIVIIFLFIRQSQLNSYSITKATSFDDKVMEAKYAIRSEQLYLMEIIHSTSEEELNENIKLEEEGTRAISARLKTAVDFIDDPSWAQEYKEAKNGYKQQLLPINDLYIQNIVPLFQRCIGLKQELMKTTDQVRIRAINDDLNVIDKQIDTKVAEFIGTLQKIEDTFESNEIQKLFDEGESLKTSILIDLILVLVISILVSLVVSLLFSKSITRPLNLLLPGFMDISNGYMGENLPLESNDELGLLTASFNKISSKLKVIVSDITTGAESIVLGSEQISNAAQILARGASEQADAAEKISSSIEQMTANIEQSNENSKKTVTYFREAEGRMDSMNKASEESLQAIRTITDKINIINDIAFQTNILALNAAVEAARAGEQGRGFAVVAAEVRKLAESSKKAADEIMSLSGKTLKATESTRNFTVELGSSIQQTSKLVDEIDSSIRELTTGANQINGAVVHMNDITQNTAASSEELATSAEEFASQAEQLKDTISFFKIAEKGRGTDDGKVLIKWGPQYYIGIKEIDDQHKVLVDIINEVYANFGKKNNNRKVSESLKKLIDYTVYHFGNEEHYFKKFGYKDTENHLKQHGAFVDKMKKIAADFESGDASVSIDLVEFLKDWLINHILKIDAKYVSFFKENGIK